MGASLDTKSPAILREDGSSPETVIRKGLAEINNNTTTTAPRHHDTSTTSTSTQAGRQPASQPSQQQ